MNWTKRKVGKTELLCASCLLCSHYDRKYVYCDHSYVGGQIRKEDMIGSTCPGYRQDDAS